MPSFLPLTLRKKVVKRYLKLGSYKKVAKEYGVAHGSVENWIKQYKKHGMAGLKPQPTRFHSTSIKKCPAAQLTRIEARIRKSKFFNKRARKRLNIICRYERGLIDSNKAVSLMEINKREFFEVLEKFRKTKGRSLLSSSARRFTYLQDRNKRLKLMEKILGKQSLKKPYIRELSTRIRYSLMKERIKVLDELFKERGWIAMPNLISLHKETLLKKIEFMGKLFRGRKRRGYLCIFGQSEQLLLKKAMFFTETLGSEKWRTYPNIFSKSIETLTQIADFLTNEYGDSWKIFPTIFTRSLDTLKRRTVILKKTFPFKNLGKFYPSFYSITEERLLAAIKKVNQERDDLAEHPWLLANAIRGRRIPTPTTRR